MGRFVIANPVLIWEDMFVVVPMGSLYSISYCKLRKMWRYAIWQEWSFTGSPDSERRKLHHSTITLILNNFWSSTAVMIASLMFKTHWCLNHSKLNPDWNVWNCWFRCKVCCLLKHSKHILGSNIKNFLTELFKSPEVKCSSHLKCVLLLEICYALQSTKYCINLTCWTPYTSTSPPPGAAAQ